VESEFSEVFGEVEWGVFDCEMSHIYITHPVRLQYSIVLSIVPQVTLNQHYLPTVCRLVDYSTYGDFNASYLMERDRTQARRHTKTELEFSIFGFILESLNYCNVGAGTGLMERGASWW